MNKSNKPTSGQTRTLRSSSRGKSNHKRRTQAVTVTSVLVVAMLALLILFVSKGCSVQEAPTELVGVWRYDEYTQYEFGDGGRGCLCLDGSTHYEFTYTIDQDVLFLDFTVDYVTDCRYTYKVTGNTLTLVGGDGTAEVGKMYELSRE